MPAPMTVLRPKFITTNHFLAKATINAAQTFDLAGTRTALKLNTKNMAAIGREFDLSASAATKLGRKQNLIECIATGIDDSATANQLRTRLKQLQVPTAQQDSQFFFVTTRRRKPGDITSGRLPHLPGLATRTLGEMLSVEHAIAKEDHFIMGVTKEAQNFVLTFLFPGRRGAMTATLGSLNQLLTGSDQDEEDEDTKTKPYPDDPNQDFAQCYSQCLSEVPPWLVTTITGICGGCVAAVGTAVGTGGGGGVTTGILIAVCASCVAVLGVVFGNCLLTCHEMLGT